MKNILITLFVLSAILWVEIGFAQQSQPFVISGKWQRGTETLSRIYLFEVSYGRLRQVSVALVQNDESFIISHSPQTEGFFVVGVGHPASRQNKYIFYLKPGDRLNFVVNDTSYTLVGENTRENIAMKFWHDYNTVTRSGNRVFDELFAKYRLFNLMDTDGILPGSLLDITANTAILTYPFGVDLLLNFLSSTISEISLENAINYISNDTLKGEVLLSSLVNVFYLSELQDLNKKFAKYIVTEDQRHRSYREIERIHRLHLEQGEGVAGFNFTYQDVNGHLVSFSDFKGKVVYVDVWATWCGPCIAELPHKKRLQERFARYENIVFVGISIDNPRDIQRWQDFVANNQLSGIQLHGNIDGPMNINRLYNFSGIPRFLLFDKDGNIVSTDAPRPSSAEIVPLLTRLLQQR